MKLESVKLVSLQTAAARRPSVMPVPLGRLALYAFVIAVMVFLLLPSLMVIPMSFSGGQYLEFPPSSLSVRWYLAYFGDPDWIGPTLFSLRIAALTALASTAIGTTAALALVRGCVRGRALINALIVAPMVAPVIIVAIGVYLLFARWHLVGTTAGFVLAHTVLAVPYLVLTVSAALYRFDPSLELAALSLGASRLTTALRITLPLMLPAVLTGAAFAFIISFDEAVVSFFISGVTGKTLPRKMFEGMEFEVSPVVAAVSALLTVLSVATIGGMELARLRVVSRAGHGYSPMAEAKVDGRD